MSKLNIRIHECGSSASSLGPSPMGVLRVGRPRKDMLAIKKNESSDAPIDWGDFDSVVRQVLWNDETQSKVRGKVYRSIPADVDIANMPSAVYICTLDDDTPMITIFPDYSEDYRGDVYVYNNNLDSKTYLAVESRIPQIAQSVEDANSGNFDYPLYTHVFPSKDAMTKYINSQTESCHSVSKKNESNEDAQAVLQANYGDGDTYYGESSANGFYATERHPMAWAILNNDVAALESLHNGTAATPDKPWNCHGWSEDIDAPEDSEGNYPYVYNMDTDYEETFVEDMPDRVVGETDNQNALRKALEYYPDFVLPFVDFWNAFHKGYDKDLLLSFLYNARNLYNDMQVDIQEYLDYDEFGKDAYNNLESFLEGK